VHSEQQYHTNIFLVIYVDIISEGFKGAKEPFLSGHTLQLITKVRYLGLVLDKALM
jgi:hypothetical protein